MDKITNQICFEKLAEKLGIAVVHGWKKEFSGRLKQKNQTIISTWIKRGVPEEFDRILRKAGIDPALWSEILENVRNLPGKITPGDMIKNTEVQKGSEGKMVPMVDHLDLFKKYTACLERERLLEQEITRLAAGNPAEKKTGKA